MPSSIVPIGALSAIYVGNAGSSQKLVRLGAQRSGGSAFSYDIEQRYLPIIGEPVQAGDASLSFALTFVPDFMDPAFFVQGVWSNLVCRLAKGNSLEGTIADDAASTFQKYSILLVSPDTYAKNNFWIPVCWSDKKFNTNFNKERMSTTAINFAWQNRNAKVQPYRSGTLAELATIIGSRSPF